MFRRQFVLLTLFVALVACTGCKKNTNVSLIPNVAVNEYIYLNNPSSFNLQVQGGWIYNDGGYRGLVVYRRYFNFGFNDFVGYERACPDHFNDGCGQLEVVSDIYLECPCTGHQYLMFDGLPISNSSQQVREYNTQFDGGNVIIVTN